jgi:hypothetical protein
MQVTPFILMTLSQLISSVSRQIRNVLVNISSCESKGDLDSMRHGSRWRNRLTRVRVDAVLCMAPGHLRSACRIARAITLWAIRSVSLPSHRLGGRLPYAYAEDSAIATIDASGLCSSWNMFCEYVKSHARA